MDTRQHRQWRDVEGTTCVGVCDGAAWPCTRACSGRPHDPEPPSAAAVRNAPHTPHGTLRTPGEARLAAGKCLDTPNTWVRCEPHVGDCAVTVCSSRKCVAGQRGRQCKPTPRWRLTYMFTQATPLQLWPSAAAERTVHVGGARRPLRDGAAGMWVRRQVCGDTPWPPTRAHTRLAAGLHGHTAGTVALVATRRCIVAASAAS